jgi:hypothetical protein
VHSHTHAKCPHGGSNSGPPTGLGGGGTAATMKGGHSHNEGAQPHSHKAPWSPPPPSVFFFGGAAAGKGWTVYGVNNGQAAENKRRNYPNRDG